MEHSNSVTFSMDLEARDFIRFNFSVLYGQWSFSILTVVMVLSLCSVIMEGFNGGFENKPQTAFIFPIVVLVVVPLIVYVSSRKSFDSRLMKERKTYSADSTGLRIKSESMQVSYLWEDFKSGQTTKNAIYLFETRRCALIFPRRAISPDSYSNFASLVKEKVPKKGGNRLGRVLIILFISFLFLTAVIHYISAYTQ